MTASPRPTCRPDTPSVSVCLSQQRGTRQTEGRSLPGAGARSARTTPATRPGPAAGIPSSLARGGAPDAAKRPGACSHFLEHVLEHFILRIFQNQTVRCFLKTKRQLLREQACPLCSAVRVTLSSDSGSAHWGPCSWRGHGEGWTQGQLCSGTRVLCGRGFQGGQTSGGLCQWCCRGTLASPKYVTCRDTHER